MLNADYAGYVRACCTFNHGTDSEYFLGDSKVINLRFVSFNDFINQRLISTFF